MCASYNPPIISKIYSIDYSKPGVVVIFNNKKFSNSIQYPTRYGSEQDVLELCNLFRELKYDVSPPHINKSEAQMRNAINVYAKRDYSSHGCFLLFIMSHGKKSTIISSDSQEVELNEFIIPLKKNASLNNKPEVIIIQASRDLKKMTSTEGVQLTNMIKK